MGHSEFSRRQFLRVAGGIAGGALAVPLLAACTPAAPAGAPTRPAAGVGTSTAATGNAVYPNYAAFANGPKADFPATGPMYDDAFSGYPANPLKVMPAEPPGTGGTLNNMSLQVLPPPTS